jgi:hypothetical protein
VCHTSRQGFPLVYTNGVLELKRGPLVRGHAGGGDEAGADDTTPWLQSSEPGLGREGFGIPSHSRATMSVEL